MNKNMGGKEKEPEKKEKKEKTGGVKAEEASKAPEASAPVNLLNVMITE
jgi:hypothetical protein